jgi:hypothetical protein
MSAAIPIKKRRGRKPPARRMERYTGCAALKRFRPDGSNERAFRASIRPCLFSRGRSIFSGRARTRVVELGTSLVLRHLFVRVYGKASSPTKRSPMRVKDIPGYEGRYIVADTGIVIACYRQFVDKIGRLTSRPSKALKPVNDKRGYRQVALCNMNAIEPAFVHRLVAAAFVPPYRGEMVNHIDLNPKNNHFSNLEWCTPQGNTLHFHLRKLKIADLTATQIDEIVALDGQLSDIAIARRYDITPRTVRYICESRHRNAKRNRVVPV